MKNIRIPLITLLIWFIIKQYVYLSLKGGRNGDAKLKSLLGNSNGWYLLLLIFILTF